MNIRSLIAALAPGAVAAALSVCAGVCRADAVASGTDALHVSGFGTVGLSQIEQPEGWSYTRNVDQAIDTSQFRADLDSRFGLQVNFRPADQFELVAQAVASRLPAGDLGDALELGFAAYRPDANWTLRVGRVNMDAFLLSDHRDVGFTYVYVRPPVEFYSQLPAFLDGGDLSRVWTLADVQWRAKVFGGRTSAGSSTGLMILSPLVGAMVSRESDGLLLRVSLVHTKFPRTPEAERPLDSALRDLAALPVSAVVAQADALASDLTYHGTTTNYVAAGAQYDEKDWFFTAEINHAQIEDHPASSFTSGYVSCGRRFGAVSVFGIESATIRSASALATPDWTSSLAGLGPAVVQQAQALATIATVAANEQAGNQRTTSVGARWDVSSSLALKLQWDHIQTSANGGELWGSATAQAGIGNVFSVTLDFVF